jgi:hypothetical protein
MFMNINELEFFLFMEVLIQNSNIVELYNFLKQIKNFTFKCNGDDIM